MHCCSTLELIFVKNKWKTNQTGNSFPTSVHRIFVSFLTWDQKKPLMLKLYVWRYCMPYDLQTSNFRQPFFFLTVCKNQEQKYRTVCKNLAGNPLHVHTCVHMCTMYVLTRHYSTSGISRISFRAQKHWCRLWNVLFEQFPSFWRCHAGVLVLLATHFKARLQLIGNDLASFSSINPTGASTNTDRVSHHTLSVCTDRYYIPTKHTDRVYFSLFFQTGF